VYGPPPTNLIIRTYRTVQNEKGLGWDGLGWAGLGWLADEIPYYRY